MDYELFETVILFHPGKHKGDWLDGHSTEVIDTPQHVTFSMVPDMAPFCRCFPHLRDISFESVGGLFISYLFYFNITYYL
jgi:hypothetical protein